MIIRTQRRVKRLWGVIAVAASAIAISSVACDGALGTDQTPEPPASALESEAFITPVAEAREGGVTPYWLGERFDANGLGFLAYPMADFTEDTDSRYPGLSFDYFAPAGDGGTVRTGVQIYSKAGDGPQIMLDRAAAVQGAFVEDVMVGNWPGKLFTLPSPPRPVNKLYLFVDLADTVVIVQPASGVTGVPGTDPNPLIDKDLLIQVVAENLRPIPE